MSRIKRCTMCRDDVKTGYFLNMNACGEPTDTTVMLYGDPYYLCPKCTLKIYNMITESWTQNNGSTIREAK